MSNPLDLSNVEVSQTYPRLVQYDSGNFYDGLGATISIGFTGGTGGVVGPQGPRGFQGIEGPQGSSLLNNSNVLKMISYRI